jgi:hypothetical protein
MSRQKKMKKLFFTAVCAILIMNCQNLLAQCKPTIYEDKFTKVKQLTYGGLLEGEGLLSDSKSKTVEMYVCTINDTAMYCFFVISKIMNKTDEKEYIETTKEDFKIAGGTKIYIALKDGDPLVLTTIDKSTMSTKSSPRFLTVRVTFSMALTKNQLTKLANSDITDYRIPLEKTTPLEGSVKPKRAKKMLDEFSCADKEFFVKK